eukprot:TRINITY_DN27380_c0_g2_i1.p1 TRINITY_DN27380_c0_g2~~TRINITY_DN27380_c0_g2_i1.p1  ORF type:complete len:649 (+),score=177.69 TRINITY_DN27380_c0_g2_i1:80-2026(+)
MGDEGGEAAAAEAAPAAAPAGEHTSPPLPPLPMSDCDSLGASPQRGRAASHGDPAAAAAAAAADPVRASASSSSSGPAQEDDPAAAAAEGAAAAGAPERRPSVRGEDWQAERHIHSASGDLIAHACSWENQRWYPIKGWSASLLPTDRPAWSSRDGAAERKLDKWPIPSVWGHPPEHCEWVDEHWQVVGDERECGQDGWAYSVNFGEGSWSKEKSRTACVRRRRWQRIARVIPEYRGGQEHRKAEDDQALREQAVTAVQQQQQALAAALAAAADSILADLQEQAAAARRSAAEAMRAHALTRAAQAQQRALAAELTAGGRPSGKAAKGSKSTPPAAPAADPAAEGSSLRAALQFAEAAAAELQQACDALEDSAAGKRLLPAVAAVEKEAAKAAERAERLKRKVMEAGAAAGKGCAAVVAAAGHVRVGEAEPGKDLWLSELQHARLCSAALAMLAKVRSEAAGLRQKLRAAERQCSGAADALLLLFVSEFRQRWRAAAESDAAIAASRHLSAAAEAAEHRTASAQTPDGAPPSPPVGPAPPPLPKPLSSKLVLVRGPLQRNGFFGWKKGHAVITVDRRLHWWESDPPADESGQAPETPGETVLLSRAKLLPLPSGGPGAFEFTDSSGKKQKWRAESEEAMVDWGAACGR